MPTDLLVRRSAVISQCGRYRYRLDREIGSGPTVVGVMVNPSTADGDIDDATIRKWLGFGARLGWGRIVIGNLFAFRATDIGSLRAAADPIGHENDAALRSMLAAADIVIAAWGASAKLPPHLRSRWRDVPRETRGRLSLAYRAWLRTRSEAAAGLYWMRWEACRRQAIERGVGNS